MAEMVLSVAIPIISRTLATNLQRLGTFRTTEQVNKTVKWRRSAFFVFVLDLSLGTLESLYHLQRQGRPLSDY